MTLNHRSFPSNVWRHHFSVLWRLELLSHKWVKLAFCLYGYPSVCTSVFKGWCPPVSGSCLGCAGMRIFIAFGASWNFSEITLQTFNHVGVFFHESSVLLVSSTLVSQFSAVALCSSSSSSKPPSLLETFSKLPWHHSFPLWGLVFFTTANVNFNTHLCLFFF